MLLLSFDTSTLHGSVALISSSPSFSVLSSVSSNIKLTYSEKLLPLIESVLKNSGYEVKDIEGLVVCEGPGSFTGLRIGLTTAAGLARALQLKIACVKSLDVIAMNVLTENAYICPLIQSRKNEVYAAVYVHENGLPYLKSSYLARSVDELLQVLQSDFSDKKVILLGNALFEYQEFFEKSCGNKLQIAPSSFWNARAENLGFLGALKFQKGDLKNYNELEPFYLRSNYVLPVIATLSSRAEGEGSRFYERER